MTKHDNLLVRGFIVFLILLTLAIGLTVYTQRKTAAPAKASNTEPVPTPFAAPRQPATEESSINSSKADRKLILRATTGMNGTTTYEFFIADISGGNEQPLFAKTLGPGSSMNLPFNAWDPSDTYLFIGEKIGTSLNYYVFKSNGEPFASGDKFIDVSAVWTAKDMGYTIREATGWASETLLIIYTSKEGGSKGPAFWFEIPSTAIIQLAG